MAVQRVKLVAITTALHRKYEYGWLCCKGYLRPVSANVSTLDSKAKVKS